MGFFLGLFRFLSYGNLIVVGFFMLLSVMAGLLGPSLSAVLILLLILGTVFYHNILCLRLQKSTLQPDVPLPYNFPSLMMVLSVLSFIYSALVFHNIFSIMRIPDSQYIKMAGQAFAGSNEITSDMILAGRKFSTTLGFIHGLAIAGNCILSSVFLNRWKNELARKENEEDTDSFLED